MTTWLSQKQYADHRGISKPAITKHLKAGKIPKSATKKHGKRILINVEAADIAMLQNVDSVTSGGGDHRKKLTQKINPGTVNDPGESSDGGERSLNDAKMKKEYYMAALKQIEYDKAKGKYVEAFEVEKQSFEISRQIRDAFLNMENRILDEIAAKLGVDPGLVQPIIAAELKNALEVLSK